MYYIVRPIYTTYIVDSDFLLPNKVVIIREIWAQNCLTYIISWKFNKKNMKMPNFDNWPEVSPNNKRSFHSVCLSGSCSYWGPTSDTGTSWHPKNLLWSKWNFSRKVSLANQPSITSYWGPININFKFGAKIAMQTLTSTSEWPKVCFQFRPKLNIWPEKHLALSQNRSQNRMNKYT